MATEYQSIGSEILNALKFKAIPPLNQDGEMICGGDQKYLVTPQTVKYLNSLLLLQKVIVLDGGGEIQVQSENGADSQGATKRRRRGA